jgi:hypothetical protein
MVDLGSKVSRRSVTPNKNRSPVMMRLRLQLLAPLSDLAEGGGVSHPWPIA